MLTRKGYPLTSPNLPPPSLKAPASALHEYFHTINSCLNSLLLLLLLQHSNYLPRMVGGLELTSLFHRSMKASPPPPPPSLSWPWPSCKSIQQPSRKEDDVRKGVNNGSLSPYFDLSESCFSNSSAAEESENLSTASEASATAGADDDAAAEALIRGLRKSTSDRLFYDPAGSTSSVLLAETTTAAASKIVEDADQDGSSIKNAAAGGGGGGGLGFEGGVAMSVDSKDPHRDFKESMEEMVMANGVKSWEWLEEMLGCYLRLNEKSSHGIIVGAFVDLLLGITASPPSSANSSSSSSSSNVFPSNSSSSSSSSSCSSFGLEIKEELDLDHPHK